MPDLTCLKVTVTEPGWENIRDELRKFGALVQVFVYKNNPTIVHVKYKQESSANSAKRALLEEPRVVTVEPMDHWPFEKRPKSEQQEQTNSPNVSSNDGVFQEPKLGLMSLPFIMLCKKCSSTNAELICSVCGTWYCNEQCQLADWANHKMFCIPRLIRGLPAMSSSKSLTLINTMQLQHMAVDKQDTLRQFAQHAHRFDEQFGGQVLPKKPATNATQKKAKVPSKDGVNNELNASISSASETSFEKRTKRSSQQSAAAAKQPKKTIDQINATEPLNKLQAMSLEEQPKANVVAVEECKKTTTKPKPVTTNEKVQDSVPQASQQSQKPQESQEPQKQPPLSMFMLRMQKKAASVKRTIPYDPFPTVGSKVTLTFVSEKMLYIRKVHGGNNDPFQSLIQRCVEAAKVSQHLQTLPNEGDVVFAPFEHFYYRAIVNKVVEGNAVVTFPDFGNSQTLHWQEMKEIQDQTLKYETCHTYAVLLENEIPFTSKVLSFLDPLVEADTFELTQANDGPAPNVKIVQLRHSTLGYNLSDKIRTLISEKAPKPQVSPAKEEPVKQAKLVAPDPATYKPVFLEQLVDIPIPAQSDKLLELVIIEASDFRQTHQVAAIFSSNELTYAKTMAECQEYGLLDKNEYGGEPKENYACLIKYDQLWTRAVCCAPNGNGQYYLLDLGIIRELDKSCPIRRYPPALSRNIYCAEFIVENPDILMKEVGNNTEGTDALQGMRITAKVSTEGTDIKLRIMSVRQ